MHAIMKPTVEIGDLLPTVSRQYALSDFVRGDEKTIHTDQAAAEAEGLAGPVAIGPQVAALIFRMLRQAFGPGWVEGGSCSLTFRRPVAVTAFCSAEGTVTSVVAEGEGGLRVACDVWVVDERGEKVIVGTASGLVDHDLA